MKVKFKKLRDDIVLPEYKTPTAVGMDLRLPPSDFFIDFEPNETKVIPLGFAMEIPEGWVGRIRARSSMFVKGWLVQGEIDSDYRGEVGLMIKAPSIGLAWNAGAFMSGDLKLKPGDRVAQLIISAVLHAEVEEVTELSETVRGGGGFGSTGA